MSRFYNDRFDDSHGYYEMQGGFDEDEFPWDNQGPPVRPMFRNTRRPCYSDAYGDYRGGYGPGGGYGPRPLMLPPMPMPMPPPPPPPPPPQPQQPMLSPPPRRGMWRRGRGFGPRGPPRKNPADERAIKYLMKCGVTKDNLKNLSHDLLRLIRPEHCGLCDFSFDTYATSRMHYISKNHLKNQKKWQTKSQAAFLDTEVPLKSRNLYCELCDIQITSKIHGEAHYDGKPHRAIVDGRKKPRNPILLQSGMESRLEHLIRREKRCLKPIKKKPEEEAVTGTETKNMPSELYCDICKTTVTCSEQMTMHMNGKRHLSKEKHHILTMMKSKGNVENEERESEEENEAIEGEGDEEPVSGDDWGNEEW